MRTPLLDPPAPGTATSRLDAAVVALGVALLAAAVVISTGYSRESGDLDWSNYLVGLAATVGLLGVAAAGHVLVRDPARAGALVGFPGAFGALAAGLMLGVALDDADATLWLVGLLIAVLGGAGYAVTRQPAHSLAAVVGLAVLYGKLVDTIFDGDGDNALLTLTSAVLVFTLLVTAVAFFLPCRDVLAVSVGAATILAFVGALAVLAFITSFFGAFAGGFGGEEVQEDPLDPLRNDVYVTLFYVVVLMLVWAALHARTGHAGYRVLVVAAAASYLPLMMLVLMVEHPSWWSLVVGVLGGGVLVAALARAAGIGTSRGHTVPPVEPGPGPDAGYPPPPTTPPLG